MDRPQKAGPLGEKICKMKVHPGMLMKRQGAVDSGQGTGGRNRVGIAVISCGTAILAVTVHGRDARTTSQ